MLSVVIPTLNAEAHLAGCLERVAGADEILVVDGGSSDTTTLIAARGGARVIPSSRGRGHQLGAGAEAAQGDWLLFLHADTVPGPDWPRAVDAHIRARPGKAGCFRLRVGDQAWQARAIERAVAARFALFALPYGDQGLLISQRLYDEVGGYRALPIMEDVDIVRRIGRKRLKLLDEEAFTSSERWRRDGWLRRSARNLACLGLYRLGLPLDRISRLYA